MVKRISAGKEGNLPGSSDVLWRNATTPVLAVFMIRLSGSEVVGAKLVVIIQPEIKGGDLVMFMIARPPAHMSPQYKLVKREIRQGRHMQDKRKHTWYA